MNVDGSSEAPTTASGARRAWRRCVGAGMLVVVLSGVMGRTFPQEGAGYPKGLGPPVIALEMARSAEDVQAVLGRPDDPATADRTAAMNRGNCLDYAFMLAYGAFLGTFFLAVRRTRNETKWTVFALLGPLAAVSDAVENVILLNITAHPDTVPGITWLAIPVWIKFFLLMISGAGAGWFLLTRPGFAWKPAGAAAIAGSAAVAAGFCDPQRFGFSIGPGLAVGWIVQLLWAVRSSFTADE